MRARLSDIARHAGVSEATVSRVLNDRPGVGASTRQAVLTALDVLGYERPAALRQHSAGLIGLVVPELENPIFPLFAQAISTELSAGGYTPVLCTQSPGGVTEDEYVEMLRERRVAGIVFVSGLHADTTADPGRYSKLADSGLPLVFVNGYVDELPSPCFSADDAIAATLGVEHLVSLGHRRIGLISGPERFVPVQRKRSGYVEAMSGVGEPLVELTMFGVEGGAAAAARLLDAGATGIICGSDLMALGAIREARSRGMAIPGDVSIVGYDDSPLIGYTDPPLTTVRQPARAMSIAAVRALLDEIAGQAVPSTEYLFRPELVVRSSTGAAPNT
ncbi:MAG TPA: LacI family DNA-binding transcriptional regulator [Stackebrandtia sp.]|jgi:DNA-binding LacI/PurR family transcriptional regulator|uniref:LacI family DNA-binding transcriptional regulator n=1 Tax=Stackebrandtia sp. TaxID=2023065 RepID=UPI002D4E65DA|nr:LacI family DNA-binding transcriptional regulator [Stackebrandtia sp.]HZE37923.1 LacI family DNA-binding transcriptional regulator [Stackebrandtia sp.]